VDWDNDGRMVISFCANNQIIIYWNLFCSSVEYLIMNLCLSSYREFLLETQKSNGLQMRKSVEGIFVLKMVIFTECHQSSVIIHGCFLKRRFLQTIKVPRCWLVYKTSFVGCPNVSRFLPLSTARVTSLYRELARVTLSWCYCQDNFPNIAI